MAFYEDADNENTIVDFEGDIFVHGIMDEDFVDKDAWLVFSMREDVHNVEDVQESVIIRFRKRAALEVAIKELERLRDDHF